MNQLRTRHGAILQKKASKGSSESCATCKTHSLNTEEPNDESTTKFNEAKINSTEGALALQVHRSQITASTSSTNMGQATCNMNYVKLRRSDLSMDRRRQGDLAEGLPKP